MLPGWDLMGAWAASNMGDMLQGPKGNQEKHREQLLRNGDSHIEHLANGMGTLVPRQDGGGRQAAAEQKNLYLWKDRARRWSKKRKRSSFFGGKKNRQKEKEKEEKSTHRK